MERLRGLISWSLAPLTILVSLACIAIIAFASGGKMFSPGPLNAQSHGTTMLGGVSSHAATEGNCAACHAPPWSRETMASRCLNCHQDVKAELDGDMPMHGRLAGGKNCRTCHTEHKGAHAALTSFVGFDHDTTGFELTGKHASLDCKSCHAANTFKGVSHDCKSCHAEPEVHRGGYGTACALCHSTSTWADAAFKHDFPLNHGRGRRGNSSCTTCHTDPENFTTYTCYGCHEHNPDRIERRHARLHNADLQHCVRCHKRGHDGEHRRGQGPALNHDELWAANGNILCTRQANGTVECPRLEGAVAVAGDNQVLDPRDLVLTRRSLGANPIARVERP
jgi:hypothetical protein